MVKSREKRNGSDAAARHAGPGKGNLASLPKAQAAIKAAGGKFLAAGGKTTTIEGEPPKPRIVIQQWDSLEKVQAYRNSAAFKDLLPLRDKMAKFRSYVVEGVPQ